MFWKRKKLTEEERRAAIYDAFDQACLTLDTLATEAMDLVDAHVWDTYRCRLRLGFAIDAVPAKNQDFAPESDELRRINQDYIEKEVRGADKEALSVLDYEVSAFDYSFLEYSIQTGALLPKRAVSAVPKAKRVMQRIAKDLKFGQFHFSPFEPEYNPDFSVSPMRINVSLWRAVGGEDSGEHPSWHNITADDVVKDHATGKTSLRVLEGGLLMFAPRTGSYSRFQDESPSSPRYFYTKWRDQVEGESGHGVWAFAGKKAHNKRIENRLPGGDARAPIAALVTMVAVAAGLRDKMSFKSADDEAPTGDATLDSYDPARRIPPNRALTFRAFKAGSRNIFYRELERFCGKALATQIMDAGRAYVTAQDQRDGLVIEAFESGQVEDVAYTDRMDRDAILRHITGFALKTLEKDREAAKPKHDVMEDKDAEEEPLMDEAKEEQFNEALDRLQEYTDPYFAVFERVRTALWEVSEEERDDRYILEEIGDVTAPLLTPIFDKLWDYLCEEEKVTAKDNKAFKMSDMSRIQTVAKYITSFIMEQTLGDMIKPDRHACIWARSHSCILQEAMQDEARMYLGRFAVDVMLAERHTKWNMERAYDAMSSLYQSFYELAGGIQNPKTPLEAMTRFMLKVHQEAELFKGIAVDDMEMVESKFGSEFKFMGLEVTAEDFVNTLSPHLKALGFDQMHQEASSSVA